MPFNDRKETLKGGTLCIDGEEIEILGGFKKEKLDLSPLLEEQQLVIIYVLGKKAVKHGDLEID